MDALEQAKAAVELAEGYASKDDSAHIVNLYLNAQAYAAIATAEAALRQAAALERIAKALEGRGTDEGTWAVVDGLNQRID
jgi:hypothetical protein